MTSPPLRPGQIEAEINSTLVDNTSGLITPAAMRSLLVEIAYSYAAILDLGTLAYQNTGSVSITGGTASGVDLAGCTVPWADVTGSPVPSTIPTNGVVYGNGTGPVQTVPVNATSTTEFLTQASSGPPQLSTIQPGDVPVGLPAVLQVGPPTTSNIPINTWWVFKDTSGGGAVLAFNDGGVAIRAVALTVVPPVLPAGALAYWVMSDYSASPNPVVPNREAAHAPNLNLLRFSTRYILFNAGQNNTTITQLAGAGPGGNTTAASIVGTGFWQCGVIPDGSTPSGTYTFGFNYKRNTGSNQQFQAQDLLHTGTTSGTLTATSAWQRGSLTYTGTSSGGGNRIGFSSFDGATGANILVDNVELYAGASDLGPAATLDGHCYLGLNAFPTGHPPLATGGYLDFSANGDLSTVVQFQGTGFSGISSATMTCIVIYDKTAPDTGNLEVMLGNYLNQNILFATQFVLASMPASISGFGGLQIYNADAGMIDLAGFGWQSVGLISQAGSLDQMLGNSLTRRLLGTPVPGTFGDMMVGNIGLGSNVAPPGRIAAMAVWPRALANSEYLTALQVMTNDVAGSSITPSATKRFMLSEGDSITLGYGTSNTAGYPNYYVPAASPILTGVNYAISGSTLQQIITRDTNESINLSVLNKRTGDKYIYTILCGTNDLIFGYNSGGPGPPTAPFTLSGFLASYAAYLDSLRSAGWYVVVCTLISGVHSGSGGPGLSDSTIAPINTAIRTWGGVHADAVCDFAANPAFAPGAYSNLTYYQGDQEHPNNTGQALLATIIAPFINAA